MKELAFGSKPKAVEQSATKVIKLYHGSPNKIVHPTFGEGKDNHDYGRGFYLTPDPELAKEWAWCRGGTHIVWMHTYELKLDDLSVLNFEEIEKQRALYWVTELLQHREPDKESRGLYYEDYKAFLISHFGKATGSYDVVAGWRADDSYFQIAEALMRDELQIPHLEDALRLGNLGIQYCCRSEVAYTALKEVAPAAQVPERYRELYLRRDLAGREAFQELLHGAANKYSKPRITLNSYAFRR